MFKRKLGKLNERFRKQIIIINLRKLIIKLNYIK